MDQNTERNPVTVREAILKFHSEHYPSNTVFTTKELQSYVLQFNLGVNAGTVSRALRELRSQGKVNYIVLNQTKGLLEFTNLDAQEAIQ